MFLSGRINQELQQMCILKLHHTFLGDRYINFPKIVLLFQAGSINNELNSAKLWTTLCLRALSFMKMLSGHRSCQIISVREQLNSIIKGQYTIYSRLHSHWNQTIAGIAKGLAELHRAHKSQKRKDTGVFEPASSLPGGSSWCAATLGHLFPRRAAEDTAGRLTEEHKETSTSPAALFPMRGWKEQAEG